VPLRAEVDALAATLYGTVPLPVPLVAPDSVTQPAFETADHVQPDPAVTPTLPVEAPATTDCAVGLIVGAHGAWRENPFETELAAEPPGPTAVTRASKTTPVGMVCRNWSRSTRMIPPLGVGLPRSVVADATDEPTGKIESEYRCTSGVPSLASALWSAEGVNST
jgi:hypothetical protein